MPHRRNPDRGAGTALAACVALVICAAMLLGSWVVAWLGQHRQAMRTADLAAIAGAAAHLSGADGCRGAEHVATQNGAQLVRCEAQVQPGQVVLTVQVRVALAPALPSGPRWVVATASAGRVGPPHVTQSGDSPI